MLRIYEEFSCPGSMSRSVVHIIRAATYDEQGSGNGPIGSRTEHRSEAMDPKAPDPTGTAPPPDSTYSVLPPFWWVAGHAGRLSG